MTPLQEAKRKLKRLQKAVGHYGPLQNTREIQELVYELKDALDKVKE
jgi:hypothetical protein